MVISFVYCCMFILGFYSSGPETGQYFYCTYCYKLHEKVQLLNWMLFCQDLIFISEQHTTKHFSYIFEVSS